MRRLLHGINLRADAPRRIVVEDEPKRKPRLLFLVVGLLILLVISTLPKTLRKNEGPEIREVEIQTPYHQPSTSPRPAPPTSLPKNPSTERWDRVPDGMKPLGKGVSPSKGDNPFKPPNQKKGEILVVLFPGKRPQQVKKSLSLRGIAFQERRRKTTITLWRVMVEATPSTVATKAAVVREITGTPPWKLTMKGTLYLAAASLSDGKGAKRLGKTLEKAHLRVLILPIKRTIELNSLTFHIGEDQWPSLKPFLERLGVHFLEETPLEKRTSLFQPVSTISQGKGSSHVLSR